MRLIDQLSEPSNWTRNYGYAAENIREEKVSKYSHEYNTVKKYVKEIPKSNFKRITRAQSPYLYFRYQLRKEEYKARGIDFTEKTLLHATDEKNIPSILKDNLDWRRVYRAKFGIGVSFSPSATYADCQCSRNNGINRAMIVAKVLIGKEICGGYHQTLPEDGYDTTTGNCGKVYVKYYDDEFYPEYICYYERW